MKRYFYVTFLLLAFGWQLFSQHSITTVDGIVIDVDLIGASESSLNESNNEITYIRTHAYTHVGVNVNVDFSAYKSDSRCGIGNMHVVFTMKIGIRAQSILGYSADGQVDSTVVLGERFVEVSPTSSYGSLHMNSGEGGNVSYMVSVFALGFCATAEDTNYVGDTGGITYFSIKPGLDVGVVSEAYEDAVDMETRTLHSGFNPQIKYNTRRNERAWPTQEEHLNENESVSPCDLYGRPKFSVNMHNLGLTVSDIEFLQGGRGPEIKFGRWFNNDLHLGMFGRGWKSSLSSDVSVPGVFSLSDSEVVLNLNNERKRYFSFAIDDSSFISKGNIDSLYFNDSMLVFIDSETKYKYLFDTLNVYSRKHGKYFLKYILDTYQNKVSYKYNDSLLTSVTDAGGRKIDLTYNTTGLLSSFRLPDGRKTSYTYDEENNLQTAVDLVGNTTEFKYDTAKNIANYSFNGNTISFEYQYVRGRPFISKITDPTGAEYNYSLNLWTNYSANTITDPNGVTTRYRHNSMGQLTAIEDQEWNTYTYDYDQKGRMIKKITPNGDEVQYLYGENNHLIKATYDELISYYMEYNESGQLISTTDPFGNVTKYVYNNKNRVKYYINPQGDTTQYLYNQYGEISEILAPGGRNYKYSYDVFGNIIKIEDNLGVLLATKYGTSGYFINEITDATGNRVGYTYDANGRLTQVTTPDNQIYEYTYNCCGLESVGENNTMVSFGRDKVNALTSMDFQSGQSVLFNYDMAHNLETITDTDGNHYTIKYNNRNLPVAIINPQGDSIVYDWNIDGRISSISDEKGNNTFLDYSLGKLYRITFPDQKKLTFIRDKMGRVLRQENARSGQVLEYTYNYAGKVLSKSWDGKTYTFEYNKRNRMLSATEGEYTLRYTRDIRDRITAINYNNVANVNYEYDLGDKLKKVVYPDELEVKYEYNAANNISKVLIAQDSIQFIYDNNGMLVEEKRSNSTSTNYGWLANGKLDTISHYFNGTLMLKLDYDYADNGNVYAVQLEHPKIDEFTQLNALQNMEYNNLNQLVSDNSNTYLYDDDGNLTTITGAVDFNASYTHENMPNQIEILSDVIDYEYNGIKQVYKKIINGEVRYQAYDAFNKLLSEFDASGKVIHNFIYAGNRLVAKVDGTGRVYFYHFDKQGSTLVISDSETELVNTYWYSPFGEKLLETETIENPFTYVGAYNVIDNDNGFYTMGQRLYYSSAGRFVQRDPYGLTDGPNLYQYAFNNPLVYIDPAGTDVANGTANLFTCEGPVYGDDFISEETADVIAETTIFSVDMATDLIPVVGDVKTAAKVSYYTYTGDYKKAGVEALGFGLGKYVGGKFIPKISEKLGTKALNNVVDFTIGKVSGAIVQGAEQGISKLKSQPPIDTKPEENSGSSGTWGPPAGIHY